MQTPTVTFVVPCYKLAHLLPDCVNSILSQTYTDFELLVLDDCSPDNTAEVVQKFTDPRVRHVRNEGNLGLLRNFNKGVGMSRGKYVWLISADDYLRKPTVLERYVRLMDRRPDIGYVFSSAIGVNGANETGVLDYSKYAAKDCVVNGPEFVMQLLQCNTIVAPSVMARRECYEQVSMFPLEPCMSWSGDWYLWCVFALYYNVAYIAEPMVCYRIHELSTTSVLTSSVESDLCMDGDVAVPWMVRRAAVNRGLRRISDRCLEAAATEYGRQLAGKEYRGSVLTRSTERFETSLAHYAEDESERDWVRARCFAAVGDRLWDRNEAAAARAHYRAALAKDRSMWKLYAKLLVLSLGTGGASVRQMARRCRRGIRGIGRHARMGALGLRRGW